MKTITIMIVMLAALSVAAIAPLDRNPTCSDIGYPDATQYKIDPGPFEGAHNIDGTPGDDFWIVTTNHPGQGETYWNWTSNIGIDAVITKGGNAGFNVETYNPEAFSDDSSLRAPNNPSGMPAEISHITICFDDDGEIPEFTTVGAALALIGAGVIAFKKRK
jgi:hypothetical protein